MTFYIISVIAAVLLALHPFFHVHRVIIQKNSEGQSIIGLAITILLLGILIAYTISAQIWIFAVSNTVGLIVEVILIVVVIKYRYKRREK